MASLASLRFSSLPELYNYVEVVLWPAIALVLVAWGWSRRGAVRRDAFLAAGVLVFFGVSDYFEANTANEWWHPWWLLLWKAGCVLALLSLLAVAWRRTKNASEAQLPFQTGAIPSNENR